MKRTGWAAIALLSAITLTACRDSLNPSSPAPQPTGETRIIEHAQGETAVPVKPERVVALDNIALDSTLAVGVKPMAALYNENTKQFPVHLRDRLEGVEKLAANRQNLEAIATLNPDLILGGKNVEQVYQHLSKIAPTLLLAESGNAEWKEQLQLTAKALGQPEKGEAVLQQYRQRLAEFQAALEAEGKSPEVSVVRIFRDRIRLYQRGSFSGKIIEEAGLSRPPSQDENRLWREVSRENIEAADGDIIFVWSLGNEAEQALTRLQNDPLWSKLDAVQNGQVYEVPGYWIGSGPIAANAVLDDLFTYVIEQ
ncbi:MAG: iron-siderophore ABC transporter substrate-binding protein [Kamptonema sp. SIO4C4]|nr:iron-siderophore ABC transporter substrate-binding protein [Kamptonema sp. SIO4C4]